MRHNEPRWDVGSQRQASGEDFVEVWCIRLCAFFRVADRVAECWAAPAVAWSDSGGDQAGAERASLCLLHHFLHVAAG